MTRSTVGFPPAWAWLVDEAIPQWVKETYSPRDSWKDKPFSREDARFFFKGIEELSELFTEERRGKLPDYFAHPRFRSAYLLYFLPLQAAKFLTLFNLHEAALVAALEHGRKHGKLRIADLGAGPGTASLAFLLSCLERASLSAEYADLPPIELHWLDTQPAIMEDGRALVEKLASAFPKLRGKVTLQLHERPWWEASRVLPKDLSLLFVGNVLNEAQLPRSAAQQGFWDSLLSHGSGGGTLFVEPAARVSSQLLSRLRDQLFQDGVVEASATSIWGPCLHAEACPLAEGRDWCHFSVPVAIPGQWFREFSKGLGSERQWVKFSYLWLSSPEHRAPMPNPALWRVISDPLRKDSGTGPRERGVSAEVLLCEPEHAGRMPIKTGPGAPRRGDLVKVRPQFRTKD